MTYRDHVDFLITDVSIHGDPIAWKLERSPHESKPASRILSVRVSRGLCIAANDNVDPDLRTASFSLLQTDRSAFGDLRPVSKSPDVSG